jgi:hypothetical protein
LLPTPPTLESTEFFSRDKVLTNRRIVPPEPPPGPPFEALVAMPVKLPPFASTEPDTERIGSDCSKDPITEMWK